jgi:hypothetical protein
VSRWLFWLVTVPARIVDAWFFAYRIVLIISTILSVTIVLVLFLTAALGW